ncbi:MAG: Ig-like domain-containing protein, partial [Nitrospirota bacterium]
AVTLTSSAVVKAKAYKSSYAPSAEANAAFTFNQPFNFTLANSGNLSVQAGTSATDTISATLSAGSTSQGVTLSASGLPAGTTASFAISSCRPNCATVVTLRTSGATPTGSYPITVTARSEGLARSTAFTLTVTAASTDTMSPTVAIASPANSATVSGSAALVAATASDNVGVVGVQFKLDGNNLGSADTTAPYSVTWNTTTATNGTHSLTAVARDAAGNSTTSSAVNVTVNNAVADTTAPSVPSTLSASVISASQINLSWNGSTDNVGVTGYKIFRGGTQIGIAPSASYAVTGLSPSTTYSFTVSAYDAAGNNSAPSASVNATTISNSSAEPLLQSSNLTYLGAFRVPTGAIGGSAYGFSYTKSGIAYNPTNNSLFLNSHIYEQKTAEISIPSPVVSTSLSNLPTAKLLQPFADLTEGHRTNIYANGAPNTSNSTYIGGLMVYGGKLIGNAFDYYDGAQQAKLSHFSSSMTLSQTGDFQGMVTVGSMNPGFVAGYMTPIPSEWQSALGGPALTGQCCIAIIGRSSMGPAAFVFDPDDIGIKNPVPATPVVYYDINHPTLGSWSNTTTANVNYNMSTAITGVAFPQGTSSVLFFGRIGIGVPCYGAGTNDQSLDRQPVPGYNGAVMYCYDPDDSSKGTHSYPYRAQVWAYDVQDLIAVKSGTKNPWEIKPYAVWDLKLPFPSSRYDLVGTAYDATTKKIYVVQSQGDPGTSGYFQGPIIHVYQVN